MEVPAARIAVTVGASGAFPLAFLAAFDRGDRVAMAAPFYPPYANILTALGMEPVLLPCGPETRFQPTVAMLEALDPRPEGLIVASPCNPAGTMLAPEELAAIARWCHANGVRLISRRDLPRPDLGHGGREARRRPSATAPIVVNSFSKYWSHDGLAHRLAACCRRIWCGPVECLAQNMFISAPARRAGGGRGGDGLHGGARGEEGRLCAQPAPRCCDGLPRARASTASPRRTAPSTCGATWGT